MTDYPKSDMRCLLGWFEEVAGEVARRHHLDGSGVLVAACRVAELVRAPEEVEFVRMEHPTFPMDDGFVLRALSRTLVPAHIVSGLSGEDQYQTAANEISSEVQLDVQFAKQQYQRFGRLVYAVHWPPHVANGQWTMRYAKRLVERRS